MAKRIKKSRVTALTNREAQNLFRKFATPLFRAATTPARKKAAHELARTLWLALISGSDIEEMIFQKLAEDGYNSYGSSTT